MLMNRFSQQRFFEQDSHVAKSFVDVRTDRMMIALHWQLVKLSGVASDWGTDRKVGEN
jgi:hypothetical protein